MTPIHHPMMSNPFQGEGDHLRTQGEGGTVMSHPFQERVGDRDESPKEGWGTVMSHPKGVCPKGGSTNHNQGEGWGQIMLM